MVDRVMRVVAFDPGPRHCGYAVAETAPADRGMTRYLAGGECKSHPQILHKVLTDERNAWVRFWEMKGGYELAAGSMLIVAVETPSGYVHEHARGADLVETVRVAGEIAGAARLMGFGVAQLSPGTWRRQLGIRLGSDHQDRAVKAACAMFVRGMPKRTNSHVRDALGLGVVVLRNPGIAKGLAA